MLERGKDIRDPGLQNPGLDFLLEPLQNDPRIVVFLERMNF